MENKITVTKKIVRPVEDYDYGEILRQIRISKKLTVGEVAKGIGVKPSDINAFENNESRMSLKNLIAFSLFTDTSVEEILSAIEPAYKDGRTNHELTERIALLTGVEKRRLLRIIDAVFGK